MAKIIDNYTVCSLTIHIKKDLQLQLQLPPKQQQEELKQSFNFKELTVDDDDDVNCVGGIFPDNNRVIIKNLRLVLSRSAIQIECLRGTTDDCYQVMFDSIQMLYGMSQEIFKSGIEYADYDSITKVEFNGPIYGLFSEKMQEKFKSWQDMSSKEIVNPISDGEWKENANGFIDADENAYKKLYEGVPGAIVIPSVVRFSIWIPTKFSKMTKCQVSIFSESVEDFHGDEYYVKSELPFKKHMELVDFIESN